MHAYYLCIRPAAIEQRVFHVTHSLDKRTFKLTDNDSIDPNTSRKMDTIDATTLKRLQELQDLVKDADPGRAPSRKALLDMLELVDFDEDVKENLRTMLTGDVPKVFGSFGGGSILAVLFIFLVLAMIVFFGYKLYKSIKEKEKKREEKKKAKQMKKKK